MTKDSVKFFLQTTTALPKIREFHTQDDHLQLTGIVFSFLKEPVNQFSQMMTFTFVPLNNHVDPMIDITF